MRLSIQHTPDPTPIAYNPAVSTPALQPVTKPFRASITPPGSKSLTNRHLLLAALADGTSHIHNALAADDTQVCLDALRTLGIVVDSPPVDSRGNWPVLTISGCNGCWPKGGTVDLHNAGTAVRFLTALATLAPDIVTIDGNARMRQRPIGDLITALNELGASIESANDGFLPLTIKPIRPQGGSLEIGKTASSQFISAMLLAAPYFENGITINATRPFTSATYIALTLNVMHSFGADIKVENDWQRISVQPGRYTATDSVIEPDASSATYFLGAAALIPGAVCTIEGLGKDSLQPDVRFVDVLTEMGAGVTYGRNFITVIGAREPLHAIDIDMADMPDASMTAAVLGAFVKGEMVIRGLHTLRHKETDRLTALVNELTKLGAHAEIEEDDEDAILIIEGGNDVRQRTDPVTIETYRDHRMAMAFSLAGLVRPGITINDPACVDKTYPNFWRDLQACIKSLPETTQ